MRLHRARIIEITSMMLDSQGGVFPCHKTTKHDDDDGEYVASENDQHCAGALIFAEKHKNATQLMRIAERLGLYDHKQVLLHVDSVFDTTKEMLKAIAWQKSTSTSSQRKARARKRNAGGGMSRARRS